jgi:hypothetical protein
MIPGAARRLSSPANLVWVYFHAHALGRPTRLLGHHLYHHVAIGFQPLSWFLLAQCRYSVVQPRPPEIVELRGVPIRTRHAADAPGLAPTLDDNAAGLAYSFVRRRGGWSQALPRMCSALWPQDASAFVSYILSIPRASSQKRGSKTRRKREEWQRQ